MNTARRDLLAACLLVGAVYYVSWEMNLAEHFTAWAERYEHIQIDELAVALFFAALASAWFSARRVNDLRTETLRRAQAEFSERQSRKKFSTLFDESLCGNFICNGQGDILLCNEAFAAMSGNAGLDLKMAHALGQQWLNVVTELELQGKITLDELPVSRPDGLPWVVMARFVLAPGNGEAQKEIHGFFADITELHLAEREMGELLEENRALVRHADQAEEEERCRIAREIHDDMGQYLTAIQLDAATLAMHGIPAAVADRAANITSNARHIQKTVHALIRRLRPVGLEELGLTDAVHHLVVQWSRQNPEIFPDLDISDCGRLPDAIALVAYRVVQESLTNIARHAKANRISISIKITGDGSRTLSIQIRDNGAGFPPSGKGGGFGLIGMRERIESARGTLSITSNNGEGVALYATIPLTVEESK